MTAQGENVRTSWPKAKQWTLAYEGGYVNDPDDPGGPTNKGITQRVYDAYRKRLGEPLQSVRLITAAEVDAIYRSQYWDAVRGDDLPAGLDFALWDFAVNSGTSRAIKELQKIVGTKVDGVIGERTLAKIKGVNDQVALVTRLCEARLDFCKKLKGWKKYGKGWQRRIMGEYDGVQTSDMGVIDRAVWLMVPASNNTAIPDAPPPTPGKASEPERESVGSSNIVRASLLDGAGKVGGAVGIYMSIPAPERYILLAGIVTLLGISVYLIRERVKAWADGWR